MQDRRANVLAFYTCCAAVYLRSLAPLAALPSRWTLFCASTSQTVHGRRSRGTSRHLPPIRQKKFLGQLSCKKNSGILGQISLKFGNFVNFSGKYYEFFRQLKYHVKFGYFVNFLCTIFGQKCLAPKVD